MKFKVLVFSILLILLSQSTLAQIKVGDSAPEFVLQGTDGITYRSGDYSQKSWMVVAWYPRAFTPSCTTECNAFRDSENTFKNFNVKFFAISVDSVEQNKKFAKRNGYKFTILSDPKKSTAEAYGVLSRFLPMSARTTFIVDEKGVVRDVIEDVDLQNAGSQLVERFKTLGVPKSKE